MLSKAMPYSLLYTRKITTRNFYSGKYLSKLEWQWQITGWYWTEFIHIKARDLKNKMFTTLQ